MPRKSNSQKKKEAEAACKALKKTKQHENDGKSANQKKEETADSGGIITETM